MEKCNTTFQPQTGCKKTAFDDLVIGGSSSKDRQLVEYEPQEVIYLPVKEPVRIWPYMVIAWQLSKPFLSIGLTIVWIAIKFICQFIVLLLASLLQVMFSSSRVKRQDVVKRPGWSSGNKAQNLTINVNVNVADYVNSNVKLN